MTTISAGLASEQQLPSMLPQLLASLSIGRSHIILDQLRAVTAGDPSELVLITTREHDVSTAAAIVVHPNKLPAIQSATLLHAGPLVAMNVAQAQRTAHALGQALDQQMHQRGVNFLQWATDSPCPETLSQWCRTLGFEQVAELEYLSGEIAQCRRPESEPKVALVPIDWPHERQVDKGFSRLVDQTYHETLDCPQLTQFRTAKQTLDGYLQSSAFAPDLWFQVDATPAGPPDVIGCLILADHTRREISQVDQENCANSDTGASVIELVYMGLLPEMRGHGMGRATLAAGLELADRRGASRMILAVDRRNRPARAIYRQAGFAPILDETVWVKAPSGAAVGCFPGDPQKPL